MSDFQKKTDLETEKETEKETQSEQETESETEQESDKETELDTEKDTEPIKKETELEKQLRLEQALQKSLQLLAQETEPPGSIKAYSKDSKKTVPVGKFVLPEPRARLSWLKLKYAQEENCRNWNFAMKEEIRYQKEKKRYEKSLQIQKSMEWIKANTRDPCNCHC